MRTPQQIHRYLAGFLRISVLTVLVGSGCVTANFTQPTASLKSSIDTASTAVGTYFTELNTFERDLYLDERVYDPKLQVLEIDDQGNPTPLIGQLFKPASIKARMDALALLGSYSSRLADLAGSQAPENFSSATLALGTNLTGLDATFMGLVGTKDPTASQYIGPVSQIIAVTGEFYLQEKRDAMFTEAVKKGAPAVTNILDLLQNDLEMVVVPLRQTGIKERLAVRVDAYNKTKNSRGEVIDAVEKREAMTVAQRQEAIDAIRNAAQQYDLLISSNPTEAINGIREAHAALLKYVQSDRRPKDFADLMSAIEALQTKVERVASAVQQIKDIKRK
jgi:hypothetical protein